MLKFWGVRRNDVLAFGRQAIYLTVYRVVIAQEDGGRVYKIFLLNLKRVDK